MCDMDGRSSSVRLYLRGDEMTSEAELSALAVSVFREFGGVLFLGVLVVFAIVWKIFQRFFGD